MSRIFATVLATFLIFCFSTPGRGGTSPLQCNAEVAFDGGQFEYAYAQWRRLLEREPGNRAAAAGLLRIEGVARDLFEESLMLKVVSPEKAKENLMTVLLITDSWSELNREARNLLGEGDSHVNRTAYRPLAELLQESSILSSGNKVARLREIAARYPNSPVPHYLIGRALEADGDAQAAAREYRKAIKIRETCVPCREALGRVFPTIP